jgi:hypothetical protein
LACSTTATPKMPDIGDSRASRISLSRNRQNGHSANASLTRINVFVAVSSAAKEWKASVRGARSNPGFLPMVVPPAFPDSRGLALADASSSACKLRSARSLPSFTYGPSLTTAQPVLCHITLPHILSLPPPMPE